MNRYEPNFEHLQNQMNVLGKEVIDRLTGEPFQDRFHFEESYLEDEGITVVTSVHRTTTGKTVELTFYTDDPKYIPVEDLEKALNFDNVDFMQRQRALLDVLTGVCEAFPQFLYYTMTKIDEFTGIEQ